MKNVSFLNRLINGGFLLLGTFILSKVLQYLILNYLNFPFFINPLSFIGEADLALNVSSLSKFTYIFFDFVCFAFFFFTLKKCAHSFVGCKG
jgi:hypothetical protein